MSKPSREIEVPKIASQSGNPGLYEVLKDIVKRASAYINELIADVNSSIDALDADKTDGSGTAGYLTKWSGTKTLGDSNVYTDGTSVTVGATTLSERFEVAGPAGAIGRIAATDGGGNNRYALLLTSPSAAQTYARLESYKSGTGAGGKTLAINASLGGQVIVNGTVPSSWTKFEVIGVAQAVLYDKGGHVFNVKAYGATGDGTTDDTTAIGLAITAAAAISPRGVVFFPPGTYKTTGAHSLNGLDGLQIVGSGIGSTVIRLAHTTNDLFSVGATVTSNLRIADMTITSDTVTRSAGWVFHVNNAYNGTGMLKKSRFENLEIKKQFNGLAFKKYEFVWMDNVLIWDPASSTTGIGVQIGQTTSSNVNQGSEIYLRGVQIAGTNLSGGTPYLGAGFLIEDTDAVYMTACGCTGVDGNALKIVANAAGHNPSNHFIVQSVFDATKNGDAAYVTGGGSVNLLQMAGCWFASAGRLSGGSTTACGFKADLTGSLLTSRMVGCTVYNTNGNGVRLTNGVHSALLVSSNTFDSCGLGGSAGYRSALYADVPSGNIAPVVSSNMENASGLYSFQTTATTNKIRINDNMIITGTSYGVAPAVDSNNGF